MLGYFNTVRTLGLLILLGNAVMFAAGADASWLTVLLLSLLVLIEDVGSYLDEKDRHG